MATAVVLPKPAGAETRVRRRRVATASRSIRRGRGTNGFDEVKEALRHLEKGAHFVLGYTIEP